MGRVDSGTKAHGTGPGCYESTRGGPRVPEEHTERAEGATKAQGVCTRPLRAQRDADVRRGGMTQELCKITFQPRTVSSATTYRHQVPGVYQAHHFVETNTSYDLSPFTTLQTNVIQHQVPSCMP